MCFVRLNDLHLNYIYLFLIIESILKPSTEDQVTKIGSPLSTPIEDHWVEKPTA